MNWEVLWVNNPERDFNLEMELWNDGELRAMVRPTPTGLEIQVFIHDHDLHIPASWLMEKLVLAQRDLMPQAEDNSQE